MPGLPYGYGQVGDVIQQDADYRRRRQDEAGSKKYLLTRVWDEDVDAKVGYVTRVDPSSAARTVTIPPAVLQQPGDTLIVKHSAGGGTVYLNRSGLDLIDGNSQICVTIARTSLELLAIPSEDAWIII